MHSVLFAPVIGLLAILFGGGNLGGMHNAFREKLKDGKRNH